MSWTMPMPVTSTAVRARAITQTAHIGRSGHAGLLCTSLATSAPGIKRHSARLSDAGPSPVEPTALSASENPAQKEPKLVISRETSAYAGCPLYSHDGNTPQWPCS
jgi:hypothetical protein